jgi:NTE family protein
MKTAKKLSLYPVIKFSLGLICLYGITACSPLPPKKEVLVETELRLTPPPETPVVQAPPKIPVIGLALGGGAARGFAHIGVLKVLEANGIKPDIVVGTSAGSVIGSIYATGISANELQRLAINLDEATITDWMNPFSSKLGGMIKGDALQTTVNQMVKNRSIENMKIRLGIVATDLKTGNPILFQRGNTGQAVRASSSVPGIFMPTIIAGREYVDGGLSSPVPIKYAKNLGADIVIAINISADPSDQNISGILGTLLQTTTIMGRAITNWELPLADVVVIPQLSQMKGTDFNARNSAILAGEDAMQKQMMQLKLKIEAFKNQ